MLLDLSSITKAITSLEQTVEVATCEKKMKVLELIQQHAIVAGVIQNFEFTYELCWKFMKRWLDNNLGSTYVDGVSRRELFRLAAEHQLIVDVDLWMDFHEGRNLTTHTYDEEIAQDVFNTATLFLLEAKSLLINLQTHND